MRNPLKSKGGIKAKRKDNVKEFYADVKKAAERDGEVTVFIPADGKNPRRAQTTLNPTDLLSSNMKIHELLLDSEGAGVYELDIFDNESTTIGEYRFGVGKPKKRSRRDSDDDDNRRSTRSDKANEMLMDFLKMKEEQNTRLIEKLVDSKDQGASAVKDATELLAAQFQLFAGLTQGNGWPLEDLMRLQEYAKSLQPNVEKEEPLVNMLNSLVNTFMLSRLPGMLPQAGAKTIPQVAGGSPLPNAAPPPGGGDVVASSPGQGSAIGGGDTPPIAAPGFSTPAPAPTTSDPQAVDRTTANAATAPPTTVDPRHTAFEQLYINTFRAAIVNGAPVDQLFGQLIKMAQDVMIWMPDNPHPLVRDLAAAQDGFSLNAAFSDFCRNVPELAERKDLQDAIRELFIQTVINPPHADDQTPDQDVATETAFEPELEPIGEDHEQPIPEEAPQTTGSDPDRPDGEVADPQNADESEKSPVG